MENQKFQNRSIIKFLVLEGRSPPNIHERTTVVYGDSAPLHMMVVERARHFRNGQLNIEASPRCGLLISATDEKILELQKT